MITLRRALAVLLMLIPFLPLQRIFGEVQGIAGWMTARIWGLSTLIALALAWVTALLLSPLKIEARLTRLLSQASLKLKLYALPLLLLIFCGLFLISLLVFNHRPHLIDTIDQLFHAKILASGKLFTELPFDYSFLMTQHMLPDGSRFYSQYPPGHLIILAAGVLMRMPWLPGIVLAVATLPLFYRFVKEAFDQKCAVLATVMLSCSPFFLFMSANYMNHISELFLVVAAFFCFQRWEKEPLKYRWSSLIGATVGALFLVRPLTGLMIGLLIAIMMLPRLASPNNPTRNILAGGLAALPFGMFYLYFNSVTTGDSFLPGYLKLWGEGHKLGFHIDPWGHPHTPLDGLRDQLTQLTELSEFLFEWPISSLTLLAGLLFFKGSLSRWEKRLFAAFALFPAIYFFYWHRDSFLGPRFLYPTIAFIVPLSAQALISVYRWAGQRSFGYSGILKPVGLRTFIFWLTAICYLYLGFSSFPHRLNRYSVMLPSFKVDLRSEANQAGIKEGIIFVSVSWGHRIISELRGLRIPASLVQHAYRRIDHCELYTMLREAQAGSISIQQLKDKIRALLAIERRLEVLAGVTEDHSLRVWAGKRLQDLTYECLEELEYDRQGFTNFAPHFSDNSPWFDGSFIFVTDLRARNKEIMERYPERNGYIYRGDEIVLFAQGRPRKESCNPVADGGCETSKAAPAKPPGQWHMRRTSRDTPLSTEQLNQIRELQSIGYVGGVIEAHEERGVTRFIEEKTYSGWNFYTSGHAPEALLVDMHGHVLHRWHHKFLDTWPGEIEKSKQFNANLWRRAAVFDNGDIIAIHEGLGMVRLNKDSQVIWRQLNNAHHELAIAKTGDIVVLTRTAHMVPQINPDKPILEDFISFLDPQDGREKRRISVLNSFERAEEHFQWRPISRRFWREFERRQAAAKEPDTVVSSDDIFHTNSLKLLDGQSANLPSAFAAGNILLAMRHLDVAVVVEPVEEKVVWVSPYFAMPHDPSITPEGHLMIFDNHWQPYSRSRVVVVNLNTGETVWQFSGTDEDPLYSSTCGAIQRLPNDNLLITESDNGRAVEVTQQKEVVWEYFNPHTAGDNDEYVAALFEVIRLPMDYFTNDPTGNRSGHAVPSNTRN